MNIHQRLASAMGVVRYIQKERKPGMKYTINTHDAVTAKVRPALLDVGIVYYPTRCDHSHNGSRAECSMTVRFVNIDEPADFFEVQTFGYGVDAQDKGPGMAMSYAMKYALLKAMGLETGDDPDSTPNEVLEAQQHANETPATPPSKPASPKMTPAEWCVDRAQSLAGASSPEQIDDWWRRMAEPRAKAQREAPDEYAKLEGAYRDARARLMRAHVEREPNLAGAM